MVMKKPGTVQSKGQSKGRRQRVNQGAEAMTATSRRAASPVRPLNPENHPSAFNTSCVIS